MMDFIVSPYFFLPLVLLSYCGVDLIITKSLVRKNSAYPLLGSPLITFPRVLLNLGFAGKAAQVLENGYKKVILSSVFEFKSIAHISKV